MGYWIQKSLPMGVSSACFVFGKVSTFLHWYVATKACTINIEHLLDDFLMVGKTKHECFLIIKKIKLIMRGLNIPLNTEKCIGPEQVIIYLGLEIDARNQLIRIP